MPPFWQQQTFAQTTVYRRPPPAEANNAQITYDQHSANNAAVLFRQLTASGVSFGGRGLELVSHTHSDDVVIVDASLLSLFSWLIL
jgi:predicted alpha/beta-hydrolase family hydrolase